MNTAEKQPRIQALARASAIIDVIAAGGEEGVALSEISRSTELNKTTAFNLIASLVTLHFVEQDEHSRRYMLGMRNIELGRIALRRQHIPSLARPILTNLCHRTNETVSLAIPDLFNMLIVDSYHGSQPLHAKVYTGSRALFHCTATGKAVMARWDNPMRQKLYQMKGLPSLTPLTITDIDTLETQLNEVREKSFAFEIEENEPGISSVATTVYNGFGEIAAAIGVTGPSNRMTGEKLQQISAELVAAAKEITTILQGYKDSGSNP